MIADEYEGKEMNTLLNRFHMWFPGGIVLGSLVSLLMTSLDLGWQAQIWIIMIPTLIYAYLFMGQSFPRPKMEAVKSIAEKQPINQNNVLQLKKNLITWELKSAI